MDGRDALIEELRATVARLEAKVEQQAIQLEQQAARIVELELELAKARKDSSTSSKPPSSDITKPKSKKKAPGRRKKPRRGGQPGGEPTNNHNEQQLRHCVIDRRITQGTRGEACSHSGQLDRTAIATGKKQDRNFFTFLLDSIAAQLQNQPAPSLLHG